MKDQERALEINSVLPLWRKMNDSHEQECQDSRNYCI